MDDFLDDDEEFCELLIVTETVADKHGCLLVILLATPWWLWFLITVAVNPDRLSTRLPGFFMR